MLQVIITATLLITGLLAPKELVNQKHSVKEEVCLETNEESHISNFHSKQNTRLFQESTNLKNENERETI
jgi:hypothetical protein